MENTGSTFINLCTDIRSVKHGGLFQSISTIVDGGVLVTVVSAVDIFRIE
jgi:hypothetical protein